MNKERYWFVNHNADLTETGAHMNRTYVKTVWEGFPAQQFPAQQSADREILEEFCFKRFGSKVVYIQGVAATVGRVIYESSEEEFGKARPIKWGGWSTDTFKLILGIGKPEIKVYFDQECEIYCGLTSRE